MRPENCGPAQNVPEGPDMAVIWTGIFLIAGSIEDVKYKQIRVIPAAVCLLANLAASWLSADFSWMGTSRESAAAGLAAAAFLLPVCFITREAVGYGDCLAVAVCGTAAGLEKTVLILETAFIFAAVPAAFLLLRRKAGKQDTLPFVPFLTAAYLIFVCLERFGGVWRGGPGI